MPITEYTLSKYQLYEGVNERIITRNPDLAVYIYSTALDTQTNLTKVETMTLLPLLSSPFLSFPLPLLRPGVKEDGRLGNQSDLSWNPNSPTDYLCERGQITR